MADAYIQYLCHPAIHASGESQPSCSPLVAHMVVRVQLEHSQDPYRCWGGWASRAKLRPEKKPLMHATKQSWEKGLTIEEGRNPNCNPGPHYTATTQWHENQPTSQTWSRRSLVYGTVCRNIERRSDPEVNKIYL
jgi:hypothetical protein